MAPTRARRFRRRPARARLARGRLDEPLRRRDSHAVLRRAEHPDRAPLARGVRADGRDRAAPVRLPVPARPTQDVAVFQDALALQHRLGVPLASSRSTRRSGSSRNSTRRAAQRHLLRARRVRVARVGRAVVRARDRRPPGLRGDGHPGRGRAHRRRRDDEGRLACGTSSAVPASGRTRSPRWPASSCRSRRAAAHVVLPRGRWAPRAAAPDHRLHHLVLLTVGPGLVFGGKEASLEEVAEHALRRLPVLVDLPVQSSWWGYYG